jgi:hypothetical protein
MDRFETHGAREERPLYERLLALPGQTILVVAGLPVLAPVLLVRGVRRLAAAARARREARAAAAPAKAAAGRVDTLVHA